MKIHRFLLSAAALLTSSTSVAASLEASEPGRFAAPIAVAVAAPASDLAANRARLLDALHDYAVAGNFPRNTDTPAGKQMYFLDPDGRPCAVSYLMIVSGLRPDVEDIAATNNAVKVTPAIGGAVAAWIRTSGFTVQEVMRIQEPSGYTYAPPEEPSSPAIVRADRARIQRRLLRVERELRASVAVRS